MRFELDQSVRLIYAERTATVMGVQPPSTYVVHTEDGYIWDVGEDELGPLNASAGDAAPIGSSAPALSDSASAQPDSAPNGPSAVTAAQAPPRSYQRPAADPYRPVPRGTRGAGWALGFMPLAMLVAEYAISFALAKPLRATELHSGAAISPLSGVAAGGAFALVGIVLSVGGLLIVYKGTQDVGLTVGYFFVRWIEGYLLTFIMTAGVLTSLGLQPGPQTSAGVPAAVPPQAASGASIPVVPPAVTRPFVRNDEGIELRFNGHQISIDWAPQTPPVVTAGTDRFPLAGSHVRLMCFGDGKSLRRTETLQPGSDSVTWPLSQIPAGTNECQAFVTGIPGYGDLPPLSWLLV